MNATVIISVYKDAEALRCILYALRRQTIKNFEIIVTEDGDDSAIRNVIDHEVNYEIVHLSQDDKGFRKTRAVNRAIAKAGGDYLLFLDGDCLPHRTWLEEHLSCSVEGTVLAGRRMHIGRHFSNVIRRSPDHIKRIENGYRSIGDLFRLHSDGARNLELIRPSHFIHSLYRYKKLNLIGCNFSCFRSDILKVNGYDEELQGIGGEDDDLHWRLAGVGLRISNVKFRAITYHLYHESRRIDVEVNLKKSRENLSKGRFYAVRGIYQNLES